ncbi:MAG: Right handed beta helix region [Solirubrobacterales bacterium]|nr:Right handed beta helix region [Solirubrobacterales bacterium]
MSAATIRTASCDDWRRENPAERRTLLAQMRAFFGAQVDSAGAPGATGPVLSERQGTTLISSYCRQSFAGPFKLYKIYGRAAAFTAAG